MTITAWSTAQDADTCVAEVAGALEGADPKLLVYFASPALDPAALATAMAAAFPSAETMGCTTAGEIVSGHMLKGSLVAMALGTDHVADVDVEVVRGLKAGGDPADALAGFEAHFGETPGEMDAGGYVGVVLVDGLSGAEERLMETLGDRMNVAFVGGSAGDDLAFERTHVFAGGEALGDAAVLALIKPANGFEIIKTQSFVSTGRSLTATKTDEATREVIEFDGRPAAEAYAEAVGVAVEDLADSFMRNPLGLMVDDEPFVRSPQQVVDDGAVRFYCNVVEGMTLDVLESTDIIADTAEAIEACGPGEDCDVALLNFNCILRTLELEDRGLTSEYGAIFEDVPTIGFSTYGEEYLGHINQTATMLLLK